MNRICLRSFLVSKRSLVGFGVIFLSIVGCLGTFPPGDDTTAVQPTGAELFRLITETDPYGEWSQFPGVEGVVVSDPPHGPMSETFINGAVEQALEAFTGQLPDGSIIVKQNLGEGTGDKAEGITVMWKVAGFDADNNDWFWANFTPEGQVNAEGKVDGCMNCHGGARANDFIFLHQF